MEMLLLYRAYIENRRRALYGLVPLFLIWVNLDDTFLIGLLILAAASIGRILDGKSFAAGRSSSARIPGMRSDATEQLRGRQAGQRSIRPGDAGSLRCRLPGQPLNLIASSRPQPLHGCRSSAPRPKLHPIRARSPTSVKAFAAVPGRLVLVDRLLCLDGGNRSALVSAQCTPVLLEPVLAVRSDRAALGVLAGISARNLRLSSPR